MPQKPAKPVNCCILKYYSPEPEHSTMQISRKMNAEQLALRWSNVAASSDGRCCVYATDQSAPCYSKLHDTGRQNAGMSVCTLQFEIFAGNTCHAVRFQKGSFRKRCLLLEACTSFIGLDDGKATCTFHAGYMSLLCHRHHGTFAVCALLHCPLILSIASIFAWKNHNECRCDQEAIMLLHRVYLIPAS